MQRALRRPNRPDPEQWSTQIPWLVIGDFNQDDLELVLECIEAIAVIEDRQKGFKLSTRIELAAVLLATAAAAGYTSGEEAVTPRRGPAMHQLTVDLVVRRALEIYAQDRM